jgi:hypothetical protein
MVYGVAYLRGEERHLRRRLYVAREEDYAARLDFVQELTHAPVKLRPRNAYEEHTPGLALNRQLLLTLTLFHTLRHQLKVPFSSKEETRKRPLVPRMSLRPQTIVWQEEAAAEHF